MNRREQALQSLQPYSEQARNFSGWSFAGVKLTPFEPWLWNYEALARGHAQSARSVLDIGTGGGERLAEIVAGLPARVTATEPWHVNAPVAYRRLAQLGVSVVHTDSLRLPFRDAMFDLVLNRHEELEPSEVARVMSPGGHWVTQQVGHDNWPELLRYFPHRTRYEDHFPRYTAELQAAGMTVEGIQHSRKVVYGSLGDLVFNLLVTPWEIPDFDPVQEIDGQLQLEDECGAPEGIVLTEARYLIAAEKPFERVREKSL